MDWEDEMENFVPPTVAAVADNWEDEYDETLAEMKKPVEVAAPSAAQIAAAREKAAREEEILANKLKFAQLENETADERKIRERRLVEEGDAAIAGELFDTVSVASSKKSTTTGIGGIPVKNREDHVNFGLLASSKMEKSTSFCIAAFLCTVIDKTQNTLAPESIDELLNTLQVFKLPYFVLCVTCDIQEIKKTKAKVQEKVKPVKGAKKAQKQKDQRHADVFDEKFLEDELIASIEDDFM